MIIVWLFQRENSIKMPPQVDPCSILYLRFDCGVHTFRSEDTLIGI
jgi:hypothetical protein